MVKQAKWQVTLRIAGSVSRWCFRWRWLWFGLALAAGTWFLVLFAREAESAQLLLPLSLLLWAGLGLCAGYWLAWTPAATRSSDPFLGKLYKLLIKSVYVLLMLLVLALGGGAIMLTFRSISLGMG